MKKRTDGKSLKKRIGRWRIGDYLRQFSIVTGGVLLTLWLTARITDSAKQREVSQTMQLITLELRDNLRIIRWYEARYNDEKRAAEQLQRNGYDASHLAADSVERYRICLTNGMGKPYRFLTDAQELFKTTGTAAEIADKRIVIDLLRSYNDLMSFDNAMGLYYEQRTKTLVPLQMEDDRSMDDAKADRRFERLLSAPSMRGWLATLPRAFDSLYFDRAAAKLEKMIDKLEKRYR